MATSVIEPPKPSRPRPRPVYKGPSSNPPPPPRTTPLNPIESTPNPEMSFSSLAERAKTHKRAAASKPPRVSNFSHLLGSDDDEIDMLAPTSSARRSGQSTDNSPNRLSLPVSPMTVPIASSDGPLPSSLPPSDPLPSTMQVVPESPAAKTTSNRTKRHYQNLLDSEDELPPPAPAPAPLARPAAPTALIPEPTPFFVGSSQDSEHAPLHMPSALRDMPLPSPPAPSPSIREIPPPSPPLAPISEPTDKPKAKTKLSKNTALTEGASESGMSKTNDRKSKKARPTPADDDDDEFDELLLSSSVNSKSKPKTSNRSRNMISESDSDDFASAVRASTSKSKSTAKPKPTPKDRGTSKDNAIVILPTQFDEDMMVPDELDFLAPSSSSARSKRKAVISDDEEFTGEPSSSKRKKKPKTQPKEKAPAKTAKTTITIPGKASASGSASRKDVPTSNQEENAKEKQQPTTKKRNNSRSEVYVDIPVFHRSFDLPTPSMLPPASTIPGFDSDLSDAPASDPEEQELSAPARTKSKAQPNAKAKGKTSASEPMPKKDDLEFTSAPAPSTTQTQKKGRGKKAKATSTKAADSQPAEPAAKKGKTAALKRTKTAVIVTDDEEEMEMEPSGVKSTPRTKRTTDTPLSPRDENISRNGVPDNEDPPFKPAALPQTLVEPSTPATSSISRGSSTKPRHRPAQTSMQALISRVNSHASSPFPTLSPSSPYSRSSSTLVRNSRSALMRIAPLHATRRTPPPPPPPPPKQKKTKKQLEREEKWEEELAEMEGWAAMTGEERAMHRRAKWEMELGVD